MKVRGKRRRNEGKLQVGEVETEVGDVCGGEKLPRLDQDYRNTRSASAGFSSLLVITEPCVKGVWLI